MCVCKTVKQKITMSLPSCLPPKVSQRERKRERERAGEREKFCPLILQAHSHPASGLPLPLPPSSPLWIRPLTLTLLMTPSILFTVRAGELTCYIFIVLEPSVSTIKQACVCVPVY